MASLRIKIFYRFAKHSVWPPRPWAPCAWVVRAVIGCGCAYLSLPCSVVGQAIDPASADSEFFEKRIRPLISNECVSCHGAEKQKGGLRLDSPEALQQGGDSGLVINLENPELSLLLKAVRRSDPDFQMPPKNALSEEQVSLLERWIKIGVPWPEMAESLDGELNWDDARKFWSFLSPKAYSIPETSRPEWARKKIDHFVLSRLEQKGWEPAPAAERRRWVRRLSFDLIGLPPDPELVERFVEDARPNADEDLVEALLESPRFGERMASLWLTMARYGEDQAHKVDFDESPFYPNAYHYRQWVIDAFNEDMPYDEFVRYQLAADSLEGSDGPNLAALGFVGLGHKYYHRDLPQVQADEWEERVDMVSRSLLGLTVACARCHDHKFDPITTKDYYALAGVFASVGYVNRPEMTLVKNTKDQVIDVIPEPNTLHLIEDRNVRDLPVHIRGDADSPGEIVPRRFLRVLCESDPVPFTNGSGRLELAEAIVSPENPLTSRVFVNRVWGLFFGRPIVPTASNFGALGNRPSHPELLDDLSVRFVEWDWSVKSLVREIVMSATYRQDSVNPEVTADEDPENIYLSRKARRRLSAEMWRDALLSVTDGLILKGGPSGEVDQPDFLRRTVFGKVSRLELNPYLAQFDYPDANVHSAGRQITTTPTQKLFLLNSQLIDSRSEALAGVLVAGSSDRSREFDAEAVNALYQKVYSRPPSSGEMELAQSFLEAGGGAPMKEDWQKYVQVLLTSNEMMYID
jgi:cytochrome c553